MGFTKTFDTKILWRREKRWHSGYWPFKPTKARVVKGGLRAGYSSMYVD
jgi:hypothetical protein